MSIPTHLLLFHAAPALAAEAQGTAGFAELFAFWTVIPFAGLLLSIAILPLLVHQWWESNRNQLLVAAGWATPVLILMGYFILATPHSEAATHSLAHAIEEYISFIALLGSLFVISGGIFLRGDLKATPKVNTAFLAVGAVLANFIGTTGASMLLIRPMLRTNSQRENVKHIPLFFIFIVSNIGGALTPIGDPPLFLGYLRGVPFFWTLEHIWPIWAMTIGILLAIFFVVDTWFYRREKPSSLADDAVQTEPLGFEGSRNFLLLLGVILAVLFLSPVREVHDFRDYYAREIAMLLLAVASVYVTSKRIREKNGFTYRPILEVAALFSGIFITMIPATVILQAQSAELTPWQYFWSTGVLSAFLDNAPTYVTFAAMACGQVGTEACISAERLDMLAQVGGPGFELLLAISVGAVFMGASSYIGNGPNFMVRAICEESGYKMPSFFGYMGWAAVILLPVFLLVNLVFFL